MNETWRHFLESVLSWLLLPATVYGAGGAMLRATRIGRTWKQIGIETIGGIIVANMLGPVLTVYVPDHWNPTMYFLAGWGGLELVAWAYGRATKLAAARLNKKFGVEGVEQEAPWDGVERRRKGSEGEK